MNVNVHKSQEAIEKEKIVDAHIQNEGVKSSGKDGIAPEFIKYGGQELQKDFQGQFQEIWDSIRVPEDYNLSLMIPIHKKGSPTECKNYRPISLLSVVSKSYKSIVEKRLR